MEKHFLNTSLFNTKSYFTLNVSSAQNILQQNILFN